MPQKQVLIGWLSLKYGNHQEFDFEIANTSCVLQEKNCNQFCNGYYNTVINHY